MLVKDILHQPSVLCSRPGDSSSVLAVRGRSHADAREAAFLRLDRVGVDGRQLHLVPRRNELGWQQIQLAKFSRSGAHRRRPGRHVAHVFLRATCRQKPILASFNIPTLVGNCGDPLHRHTGLSRELIEKEKLSSFALTLRSSCSP